MTTQQQPQQPQQPQQNSKLQPLPPQPVLSAAAMTLLQALREPEMNSDGLCFVLRTAQTGGYSLEVCGQQHLPDKATTALVSVAPNKETLIANLVSMLNEVIDEE